MSAIVNKIQYDTLLSVIIPSVIYDIDKLLKNVKLFFQFLPIKNIYIAAPDDVGERLAHEQDDRLIFVN